MKKVFLALILIGAFGAYIVFKKYGSDDSAARVTIPTIVPVASPISNSTRYKDGTYTGPVTDAFYGPLQVQLVISGGKISDVKYVQFPNDRERTIEISNRALPILKSEAITAQSANVDIVSGATQTSDAFIQSLKAILPQAAI